MPEAYVVTTSYPRHAGDAQGHFVAAEVRRLCETHAVTVLAPGRARASLGRERVLGLGGDAAFGFPGALARLKARPWRAAAALGFVARAQRWLGRAPPPARLIAHFLLPCGVPIATRGHHPGTELEVVVHGSDARLLLQLPLGPQLVARELVRTCAQLRFVSKELSELVLGALPTPARRVLEPRSRVEPCAIDTSGVPSRSLARDRLGLHPSAPIAVIVARLVPSKRVDVALRACARVPGLTAIVIGDGPERTRLMTAFPTVRFEGHLDRSLALTYVAAANALVSASRHEGAPTVVREARALGTPVVCLEAGDVRAWAARDPGIHVVG